MADKTLPTGLIGGIEKRVIEIFDYDPLWPVKFREQANRIAKALGDAALQIEHIGSTSVPGLAAKPIIDVLLVVNEAGDEAAYLPALEAAGYVLRVREPDFYEHRACSGPRSWMSTCMSFRKIRRRSNVTWIFEISSGLMRTTARLTKQ